MSKTKSQLRQVGYWPDARAPAYHPPELTVAARRMAEAAPEELGRLGITVTLEESGRARFRAAGIPPPKARRAIEIHGDLIETYLIERAIAALKRQQESGG